MTSYKKDTLFNNDKIPEDFVFNERVVEVFDDMLDRSIPFYREVIAASAQLLQAFLTDNDRIYDLGCSTGTSLMFLAGLLADKKLNFIGIDNSKAMLDKAKLKAELYGKKEQITLLLEDITNFSHTDAGAVVLNYTLQFVRPLQRPNFLVRIYNCLRPGGVLLLSEKVINHEPRLNREYISIYHEFKKSKGYSELEIAKKREALENILIPFSVEENCKLLKDTGFTAIETYFRWFNFVSLIAVKPA